MKHRSNAAASSAASRTAWCSLFYPLRNENQSETRYNADPHDLIAAHIDFRQRGAEILALYHSHPRWEAIPSKYDLAENHYGPVPRIIVSLKGDVPDVRVWRLDADAYDGTFLGNRRGDAEEGGAGHVRWFSRFWEGELPGEPSAIAVPGAGTRPPGITQGDLTRSNSLIRQPGRRGRGPQRLCSSWRGRFARP